MEWSKEPFDDVLAQQAAMKIIIGSLIDRLVSERHRDDQIRELCDFAVRSCDGLNWRDADEDRSEKLSEMVRDEITRFFNALMNTLPDPSNKG